MNTDFDFYRRLSAFICVQINAWLLVTAVQKSPPVSTPSPHKTKSAAPMESSEPSTRVAPDDRPHPPDPDAPNPTRTHWRSNTGSAAPAPAPDRSLPAPRARSADSPRAAEWDYSSADRS